MKKRLFLILLFAIALAAPAFAQTCESDTECDESRGPGFECNDSSVCEWMPPIGIPKPGFGIEETVDMYVGQQYDFTDGRGLIDYPISSVSGKPYTHYIDNTPGLGCTDSGNVYGTEGNPRCSYPDTDDIFSGSVIEFHGGPYVYDTRFINFRAYTGTLEQPVFVRGGDVDKTVFRTNREIRVAGEYFIIENFELDGCSFSTHSEGGIRQNISFRNNNIHNGESSGIVAGMYDIVVYNNEVHHFQYDNRMGVVASKGSRRIWVVDNHIHHNAEDAFQTGHAMGDNPPSHIYVGRNLMHSDRENAVDLKSVQNAIVSQNTMYGYKSASSGEAFCYDDGMFMGAPGCAPAGFYTSGSDGTAIVVNNANDYPNKDNLWFVFNKIHDSVNGFRGQDSSYFVGNVVYNMSYSGVILWAHSPHMDFYAVNNIFYDLLRGFNDGNWGERDISYFVENNIIAEIKDGGFHIYVSNDGTNPDNVFSQHNLLVPENSQILVRWDGIDYSDLESYQAGTSQGLNSVASEAGFADETAQDFSLSTGSPAIGAGIESSVYAEFETLYGIDIHVDFDGNPRTGWDIGAFESTGSTCVDTAALLNHISLWEQGSMTMPSLISRIAAWKAGTGCP